MRLGLIAVLVSASSVFAAPARFDRRQEIGKTLSHLSLAPVALGLRLPFIVVFPDFTGADDGRGIADQFLKTPFIQECVTKNKVDLSRIADIIFSSIAP